MNGGGLILEEMEAAQLRPALDPVMAKSDILSFWQALYGDRHGKMTLVSGFLVGPKLRGVLQRRFVWPDQCSDAADWAVHEATLGRDLFQSGYMHKADKKISRPQITSVYGEFRADDLTNVPEPSLMVESAPGLFQCYWKLDAPVKTTGIKKIMDRLSWHHDRLVRIPGTKNHRYHGAPISRMVSHNDATYTREQIESFVPDLRGSSMRRHDPVPARRGQMISNPAAVITGALGTFGLKAGLAMAAAVIAVVGSATIPHGATEPTVARAASADIGSRAKIESPLDVPATTIKRSLGSAPIQAPVTPSEGASARRPLVDVADKATDITADKDGIPPELAERFDKAKSTYEAVARVVWSAP